MDQLLKIHSNRPSCSMLNLLGSECVSRVTVHPQSAGGGEAV